MSRFACFVPGEPVPKGRPRKGKNGNMFTPERTRAWEEFVAWHVKSTMKGTKPFTGPLKVELAFAGAHPAADLDNLVKAALDGCNGVLFLDDKQVVDLHAARIQGAPGALIDVEELP